MTKIICNVNLFDEKQTIHEYSFETNTITKTITCNTLELPNYLAEYNGEIDLRGQKQYLSKVAYLIKQSTKYNKNARIYINGEIFN